MKANDPLGYEPESGKSRIIAAIVAVVLMAIVVCDIANAGSPTGRMTAVVSFDDAEQLAAISDSITNVCDTTVTTITRMEEGHGAVIDSFRFVLDTIGTTITCRELVSRTIETHRVTFACSPELYAVSLWERPRYPTRFDSEDQIAEISRQWGEYYAKVDSLEGEYTIPGTAIITRREVKR